MRSFSFQIGVAALAAAPIAMTPAHSQEDPTSTYWVYVAAESADLIHLIRFGPDGAAVEKTIPVGESQVETEGPHGLRISRDGRFLYMTTGHGVPDGKLWKIEIGADTVVERPTLLGFFPATVDLTPDGLYAFVVNFNLHGERVPSSVSVVYTPTVTEVTQTETCVMPHGGRLRPQGDRYYTNCMMDDQLVEIDTYSFDVARRFSVAKGHEGPIPHDEGSGHGSGSAAMGGSNMAATCSPTWALTDPAGENVFVACNKGDEILEISIEDWTLNRKIEAGRGPYNLAITPDGRTLIATLKQGGAVQFFDVDSGRSLGIVESSTTVTHGIEVSSDSRYAFVSVEGVGAEPGKVDIFHVASREMVASVEVAQQAGGIAFWRQEPTP